MDGIVEALLRLEGAKHIALVAQDAEAYDECVDAQLDLLDSVRDLDALARNSPQTFDALEQLHGRNNVLYRSLREASSDFGTDRSYKSAEELQSRLCSGLTARR